MSRFPKEAAMWRTLGFIIIFCISFSGQQAWAQPQITPTEATPSAVNASVSSTTFNYQRSTSEKIDKLSDKLSEVTTKIAVLESKASFHNESFFRLELILAAFAALLTIMVIFFSLRTERTATAEALKEVKKEIGDRIAEIDAHAASAQATLQAAEIVLKSINDRHEVAAKHAAEVEAAAEVAGKFQSQFHNINNLLESQDPMVGAENIQNIASKIKLESIKNMTDEELFSLIQIYLDQKDWKNLLDHSSELIARNPANKTLLSAVSCKATAMSNTGDANGAIDLLDEFIAKNKNNSDDSISNHIAYLQQMRVGLLYNIEFYRQAVDDSQYLINKYRNNNNIDHNTAQHVVASSMLIQSLALKKLENTEESTSINQYLIENYESHPSHDMRYIAIQAAVNNADIYKTHGDIAKSIEISGNIFDTHYNDPDIKIRRMAALCAKERLRFFSSKSNLPEQLKECRKITTRFSEETDDSIVYLVVTAMYTEAVILDVTDDRKKASHIYQNISDRFSQHSNGDFVALAVRAMSQNAMQLDNNKAVNELENIYRKYQNSTNKEVQSALAETLLFWGLKLAELSRIDDAKRIFWSILRKYKNNSKIPEPLALKSAEELLDNWNRQSENSD